jgi:hypothetical protein
MAKVGPFILDPKAGAYCRITLDSGEKILINHEQGGFKGGRLVIEQSKFFGFSADRVFECDLDSPRGRAALAELTSESRTGTVEATPLGAFVEYVKDCKSVAEVRTKCSGLVSGSVG